MSAAGTPSTDPWVIQARERARYEEQFKSLKPNNGIITGDQAKGYLLQSQLPPVVLGRIWSLADMDADGKMDINEFSIACKLINLKLRGFEVPKELPPSLLVSLGSLATQTPPAIPPLPNPALISHPPARPEPPRVAQVTSLPQNMPYNQSLISTSQPVIPTHPLIGVTQPLISVNQTPSAAVHQPLINATAPPLVQGLTGIIPNTSLNAGIGTVSPLPPVSSVQAVNLIGGAVSSSGSIIPTGVVPPMQANIPPLVGSVPPLNSNITNTVGLQGVTGFSSQPSVMIPNLTNTGIAPSSPPISTGVIPNVVPSGPVSPVGSIGASSIPTAGPGATSTPRASVASLDRTASIESGLGADWGVPHQTKLKYTQIFNTMDRTRSGFLSGAQARNIMVQSKLPHAVLAQVWALADMDTDGRLGCEEFVLAMHLCEQAQAGVAPPAKLPPDLIPPSFRRPTRTASVSSQGSIVHPDQDPASTLQQTSFEDKRKENYEKGQAELERRRKTLMDQQRKEAEERERKEREEQERKEKARQEAERKRMEELEKIMREQQEKERLLEEERKRQAEQREAARKEMERQRQLEWEKQRLQELQQQRQREQENVLKLKAKNQSLSIELSSLNEQVRELSQKICDTRIGVSNVKTTIDGMRSTRDTQMQEMSQLKNKLKDQNARLLALSQEKVKLDAKNKINTQDSEQAKLAFENKEIVIKNLKEKMSDMQAQIDSKLSDIENNNSQLTDLKSQMNNLISDCEALYITYEEKRNKVLDLKSQSRTTDYSDAWKGNDDAWGTNTSSDWPVDNNWGDNTVPPDIESIPGVHKYRAIYEFNARNNDEISFQPGDIIHVPEQQTGEPGWLAGEIGGHTGWFPESYVEPVDGVGISGASAGTQVTQEQPAELVVGSTKLESVSAANEVSEEPVVTEPATNTVQPEGEPEYYIANYPYQSQEPGDLTFNAGDVIAVYKKDGDWWTGKLNENCGIFPSNYVQLVDNDSSAKVPSQAPISNDIAASTGVSAAEVKSALENMSSANTVDNEVSQINENKATEKPLDASITANAQVLKGKKPEIASVIAPYQATSPEQLSLARGQLIMIRKKTDSGWWEGELQAKGRKRQVGWFPASYVKILNSSGKISGRTTPVSTSRMQQEVVIDKVIALYPYTAINPDELSFLKDDIINVTAREEEAWWRGELNGVSGLFPSNYVAPLQQNQSSYEEKNRLEAINELIKTETAYIQDMSIVHEVFEIPLRKSKVVSIKEIDGIFVNWRDILQCNQNFLDDLTKVQYSRSNTVGDVICRHLPRMTAYITFCGKQLDSATLLQQLTESSTAFKEFSKKCQSNYKTKGMPLSSFLLKPMQRITKYPLLINKILENTDVNHPDYKLLEEALRISEKFLNSVNENVRLKENQERMAWLQQYVQNELNLKFDSYTNKLGPRQLLHFGTFTKVKSGRDLLGFLFNDLFMLVQPSKSISSQFTFQRNYNIIYKMYKQPILIQFLSVSRESTDSVEYGTDSNRVVKIHDEKTGYKIFLLASTVHECSTWTKKIEAAKETFQKIDNLNKQNKRKTQLHLGPLCGRLLVLVQKGKRLMLSGKSHTESVYCKVTLGNQEQETNFAKDSFNNGNISQNGAPQSPCFIWDCSMQFQLRNINEEILTFTVLEQNLYSLDVFLGKAELKLKDIYEESQNTNGPITKKLLLHQVESGEITVKLDLHIFKKY
ncbi:intersectin-1 isoform X3 [Sitophilus oryzae]|uniref:Intersectin-1 isoform X3 n=1 Tax=Sitophilus oryzae TaxID=7048 RepID=A0A6J2XEA3_SITOR|nr:intersectin-1 isoform X3 [Sitophilus oryzae]